MPKHTVSILGREAGTETETRIRAIVSYLKQHQRWVGVREVTDHFGYPYSMVYVVLMTLRTMGHLEVARAQGATGRPQTVFHWVGGRPRPVPEAQPPHSTRREGETRGRRSLVELAGPPAPSAPPTRIDVPARPSSAPPAPEASEK